jgi:hypothetical protein
MIRLYKIQTLIYGIVLLIMVSGCVRLEIQRFDSQGSNLEKNTSPSESIIYSSTATAHDNLIWYTCIQDSLSNIERMRNGVIFNLNQYKFSCFGLAFSPVEYSENMLVRVKLKASFNDSIKNVVMHFVLINDKDEQTNYAYTYQRLFTTNSPSEILIDFQNEIRSTQSTKIKGILMYVNAANESGFSGSIAFSEISFIQNSQ